MIPRRTAVGGLVALLATQVGLALRVAAAPPPAPPPAAPSGAGPSGAAPVVAAPERLGIPAIGLDVPLATTGTDGAGVLVPPDDPGTAAWFTGSVRPGAPGPAVVVGHVDSRRGPGVFRRLAELGPRDVVEVRSGGAAARFRVTGVATVPKSAFPTRAVYGPVPGPELRLITCGGGFDATTRHYRGNVVVTAVLLP